MTTSTVATIVDTIITDVGEILAEVLPTIFGFAALIVALFFAVRFILSKVRRAGG